MAVLPAGMRNNNPGNIKFIGQPGARPSVNTDQGDPQAVYESPQAGMRAMYDLLMRKYLGGKVTPRMIIAGQGGWTPGNEQAAANIAKTMGVGLDDNINLTDPANASRFMRALMLQEHGQASLTYGDDMIQAAIQGDGTGTQAASNPYTTVATAAFPYKLYGGATREDAITGMNKSFSDALLSLYNAAPPEVQRELGLNSAYRNAAIQQQLWDKSDKTGRNVAPPGKSRHQFGEAADLYGFGLTKDQVSQATKDWVTQNAQKYGLFFPMEHEPWHIQLAKAQGQAGPGASPGAVGPHVQHPPTATVGQPGPAKLGTPAATDADEEKQPWWKKMLGDMAGGATNFGEVGKSAAAPLQPSPGAAVNQLQPMSPVNPQQEELKRQMLAQAMARLNQGVLWS